MKTQSTLVCEINSKGTIVGQHELILKDELKEDKRKELHDKLKDIVFKSEQHKTFFDKSEIYCDYKIILAKKKIEVSFSKKNVDGWLTAFTISSYYKKEKHTEVIIESSEDSHKISLGDEQLKFLHLTFEKCIVTEKIAVNNEGAIDGPNATQHIPDLNSSSTTSYNAKGAMLRLAAGMLTAGLSAAFVVSTKAALTHTAIMLGAALSISPVGAAVIAGITGAALIGIVGFTLYKVYQHSKSLSLQTSPNSIFETNHKKGETDLPGNATFPQTPGNN